MCRIWSALFFCAAVFVRPGTGQDQSNVSTELSGYLARAWNSAGGAQPFLRALNLYTAEVPTTSDAANALAEVKNGLMILTSPPPATRPPDLADKATSIAKLLTEASQIKLDKNNSKAVDALFKNADAGIKAAYLKDLDNLDANVKKLVTDKNYPRALYELLALTFNDQALLFPGPPANVTSNALIRMDQYRACYAIDPVRLFTLVSDVFK